MNKFMDIAIKEAKKASKKNEIPIGCVIVKNNKIISKAHNLIETKKDVTCHAEILAIKKASKKIKNWRLLDCDLYVNLEPCNMCQSAINLSRIKNVYYCVKQDKHNLEKKSNMFHLKEYSNIEKEKIQYFFKKIR